MSNHSGISASTSLLGGLVDSINATLGAATELVIDVATVGQVRTLLQEAKNDLITAQAMMPAIPASAVGGSYWGSQLSHHSTLACDRLMDVIEELGTGLDTYESAMGVLLNNTLGADDTTTADFDKGAALVEDATDPLPLTQPAQG